MQSAKVLLVCSDPAAMAELRQVLDRAARGLKLVQQQIIDVIAAQDENNPDTDTIFKALSKFCKQWVSVYDCGRPQAIRDQETLNNVSISPRALT